MVEGVLAIDAEQRVLRMNQAASELLGVDAARAEGRILPEVVRNTDLQRLLTEVLASRQPAEGDVALRDRDQRMLYVHGTVLDDVRPGESGALLVLHDVTELRKLERMRRDFVANVSHELKTPVTSIQGFVETLLDGAVNDPQERDRFLRIVAAQTDRLSAIIDDLLTLARVEQGAKVVLSPGPVAAVLEAAVTTCKLMAEEMNVSLQWTCPPDLQATMNPSLLEQAVVNLIDNAVKYSAAGQTVRVEAGRADGEVFIRVIDQGCGIGSEHLPRIFERFYRVDKARSRKLGGTGLGLAIVKHIVQLHGGQVTVDSAPGRGSTFTVRIK
jgi:two-component system phosphate regulon sensor histidine kinase PhoR